MSKQSIIGKFDMAHEIETMAYAGDVPWHGLGKPVPGDLTPAQMLKAAGLDWGVEKRQIYLDNGKNGLGDEIPNQYALTRVTDNRVLSIVGRNFKPTQNEQILEFFKDFVMAGDMDMETAGSLQNGQFIWALAKINASFTLGKEGDDVHSYLLLMQPHLWGYARTAKFTPIRVVCKNTLTYALGAGLTGKNTEGKVFRMTNARAFDDKAKEEAKAALGIAVKQAKEFESLAKLLARKRVKRDKVEEYFQEVLNYDPTKKTKEGRAVREPVMLDKFRTALIEAPGQDFRTAKGTWWGALNAVTNVVDHKVGRNRGTALTNAWIGDNAVLKRRAVDIAVREAA